MVIIRYHLNGPVHMMTARKRVGPLPTHRLAVRHSTDHSSSDSSSEASSDFHSDASSDSSREHPLSPMTSVPTLSPVSGALSPIRADLIPSPKRVRDSGYSTDIEVDPRETSLRDDAIVRVSDKPHLEHDSDPEIQAEIDECCAYADALRDRGMMRELIVGVESAVIALTERIAELERDNIRLRGTASVERGTNPDSMLSRLRLKKARRSRQEKRLEERTNRTGMFRVFSRRFAWVLTTPTRQVEFQIDLVPWCCTLAQHRIDLHQPKGKRLSTSIVQELSYRGFIRSSSTLGSHQFFVCQKKMVYFSDVYSTIVNEKLTGKTDTHFRESNDF
ncbi:hypothetical protein Tco_0701653 [Tanacetum coccineum]